MLARKAVSTKNYSRKRISRIPASPFEMILSKKFVKWNKLWQAPYEGMFSYQSNNITRYFEYPWAFYAVKLKKGMNILDFGGGLSGLQFVLYKCGVKVHNVDPGIKNPKWAVNEKMINKLNKKFDTKVKLYNNYIEKVKLPSNFYDVVYNISVLEHLKKRELSNAIKEIFRILKPRGYLVMTVDLFLNAYPFTKNKIVSHGENVSIKKLINLSKMKLVHGCKSELFGFKEFNKKRVLENLHKYIIGFGDPCLVQTIVLQKN